MHALPAPNLRSIAQSPILSFPSHTRTLGFCQCLLRVLSVHNMAPKRKAQAGATAPVGEGDTQTCDQASPARPKAAPRKRAAKNSKAKADPDDDISLAAEAELKPKHAAPAKKARGKKGPRSQNKVVGEGEGGGDGEEADKAAAKPKRQRKKAASTSGEDPSCPSNEAPSGYWLMKNEPEELSLGILKSKPNQTWYWDGVRNYQARNFMRQMKIGDQILFYYSSCKVPGIAGIVKVAKLAYPDHTAWDPKSPYYDEKSTPDNPRWDMVDVEYVEELPRFLTLEELRRHSGPGGMLEDMYLFTRFRLSVQPLSKLHFEKLLQLAKEPAPSPMEKVKKPRKKAEETGEDAGGEVKQDGGGRPASKAPRKKKAKQEKKEVDEVEEEEEEE